MWNCAKPKQPGVAFLGPGIHQHTEANGTLQVLGQRRRSRVEVVINLGSSVGKYGTYRVCLAYDIAY